ncbi:MAG: helix-turn-helix domain-containing protein [Burkholderiales bacterium]
MKKPQNTSMPPHLTQSLKGLGEHIARLRKARRVLQAEAAVRANISRETASRIENGDAGVAIGQIVRYLDVIAPGADLGRLYQTEDAALAMLESAEKRQRARKLSPKALKQYDF